MNTAAHKDNPVGKIVHVITGYIQTRIQLYGEVPCHNRSPFEAPP